jgi:hypothetical protein
LGRTVYTCVYRYALMLLEIPLVRGSSIGCRPGAGKSVVLAQSHGETAGYRKTARQAMVVLDVHSRCGTGYDAGCCRGEKEGQISGIIDSCSTCSCNSLL